MNQTSTNKTLKLQRHITKRKLIPRVLYTLCLMASTVMSSLTHAEFTHQAAVEAGVSYMVLREPNDDTRNLNLSAAGLYRPIPYVSLGLGVQVGLLEMLFESEDNHDITGAPLMFPVFAQIQLPVGNYITLGGRAGRALGLYRYEAGTCSTFIRIDDTSACTDGNYSERHVGDYFGANIAFKQTDSYGPGVDFYIGFSRLQLPNNTRFNFYEVGFRAGFE